ncbi:MAG: NTP transferase domain-containing protein [Desulfotignum sp.]|nr:NTP transferase domain-containing protein [Desulfotignum sp.]MCF8125317.1 NTP transferase domain-containing protein [Desulfotignum sp.]
MDALAVIILAAGKGTRMKSDLPKVLHKVAGKPMVIHVIACARQLTSDNHIHVVVGHQAQKVRNEVAAHFPVGFCLQHQLLGTGDAVKCALPDLARNVQDVLVLYGDVPLIQARTLFDMITTHRHFGAKITILAADLDDPTGYGRIIQDQSNQIVAIREEADTSDEEKKIQRINTGVYCFDQKFLTRALSLVQPNNHQAEYYLTDLVDIAVKQNEKMAVKILETPHQILGINTLAELEKAQDLIGLLENELP